MCGLEKPLADSHLMPASTYRGIDKGTGAPFLATNEAVLSSNKQLKAHLLCDDCELILSAGGEDYMVPLLGTFGKKFPLYDLLKQHAGHHTLRPCMDEFYVRDGSSIDGKKIAHFAIGIFWKASVHHWKMGNNDETYIELGDFKEPLRRFLTGSIAWLGREYSLHIYISKPEHLNMLRIVPPAPYRSSPGTNAFQFTVPGIILT